MRTHTAGIPAHLFPSPLHNGFLIHGMRGHTCKLRYLYPSLPNLDTYFCLSQCRVKIKLISPDKSRVRDYWDQIIFGLLLGKGLRSNHLHNLSPHCVANAGTRAYNARLSYPLCVGKHPQFTIKIGVANVSTNEGCRKNRLSDLQWNNGWLQKASLHNLGVR